MNLYYFLQINFIFKTPKSIKLKSNDILNFRKNVKVA